MYVYQQPKVRVFMRSIKSSSQQYHEANQHLLWDEIQELDPDQFYELYYAVVVCGLFSRDAHPT
jgi:hypothetical protein